MLYADTLGRKKGIADTLRAKKIITDTVRREKRITDTLRTEKRFETQPPDIASLSLSLSWKIHSTR